MGKRVVMQSTPPGDTLIVQPVVTHDGQLRCVLTITDDGKRCCVTNCDVDELLTALTELRSADEVEHERVYVPRPKHK